MTKFTWRTEQICPVCESSFLPVTKWQICCSYECGYTRQNRKKTYPINTKDCFRCGLSLRHKRSDAIYCSKTCKSMDHNFKHRSGTRVQSTARRRLIWERDKGICYICQKEVSFDSFDIDHLVPVFRGGDNSPQNLAVTHPNCNRSRGTRIGVVQLLKISELKDKI